jgi:hypothetical protein
MINSTGSIDEAGVEKLIDAAYADDGRLSATERKSLREVLVGYKDQIESTEARTKLDNFLSMTHGTLRDSARLYAEDGAISTAEAGQIRNLVAADNSISRAEKLTIKAMMGFYAPKLEPGAKQLLSDLIDSPLPAATSLPWQANRTQESAFQSRFASLDAPQKKATLELLDLLSQDKLPENHKAQIRDALQPLGQEGSMKVGRTLNALGVYLPGIRDKAPGAEDATARLKHVFMGKYDDDEAQSTYVQDMIRTAKSEGFKVILQVESYTDVNALKRRIASDMPDIQSVADLEQYCEIKAARRSGYMWAEDNKWLTADGKEIKTTPSISESVYHKTSSFTTALKLEPTEAGYAEEGHHTAGHSIVDTETTKYPSGVIDEGSLQGAVTQRREHLSAEALAEATGKKITTTRTYNEGGNMLVGTKPNGEPYAIVGRDGVLMSVFHLEERYRANPGEVPEFAPANIAAKRQSMTFDEGKVNRIATRLEAAGEIPRNTRPETRLEMAKDFMAKMDITQDIFADDVGVAKENLIFVPQPEFHIDMHMRPLAPGQLLLNDFDACKKLLEKALAKAAPNSWEAMEIHSMLDHNEHSKKAMGPVIDFIAKRCEDAGLEVIRTAGVMEGQFPEAWIETDSDIGRFLRLREDKVYTRTELGEALAKRFGNRLGPSEKQQIDWQLDEAFTRHVNFMNGVPATRPGTNHVFYMTNHTSIEPLREAFTEVMSERGVQNIYWLGNDGEGGESSRSAAENSLMQSGGLDCRENH